MPRPNRIPRSVSRCSSEAAGRTVHKHLASPRGFTLVELLMVIAIIGILVGMGVVGINAGAKAIQKRAIALEVAAISQAVEAYKMKYGDYPPDGSSRAAFEAHYRKAFPNIAGSEFNALVTPVNGRVFANGNAVRPNGTPIGYMDPAEALVFCLGGFSKDPVYPFTGDGGPIHLSRIFNSQIQKLKSNQFALATSIQYNVDRNQPFFEFNQGNLTLILEGELTVSDDENLFKTKDSNGNTLPPDRIPAFVSRSRNAPLVYFAASTYSVSDNGQLYFNFYSGETLGGVARPYKSDQVNTSVGYSPATADRYYRYANDKSFQIISAGLDDDFGGTGEFWSNTPRTPRFFRFPTGEALNITRARDQQPSSSNYQVADQSDPTYGQNTQLDNVTNFSEGPLEDSLP